MPIAYEPDLSQSAIDEIKRIAQEKGITEDEAVKNIVQDFLLRSSQVTRFAAKKGPKK